jgi:hypothetical protein
MENNSTPNSDFEKFIRKNLQQIDASPDDNLWEKIAHKQSAPDPRSKPVRVATYVVSAVLLVLMAAFFLWTKLGIVNNNNNSVSPAHPQEQKDSVAVPMAQNTVPSESALPLQNTAKRSLPAPSFSTRANSVPSTSVSFNAETGLTYQSPVTGTLVKIPANSLVDQSGNPVTGQAELMLREYRNIEEFLAAGIPMHYGDGRGDYSFNSGGMFEVRVSQAGLPLSLGEGKSYNVNFSPTNDLDQASLYYFNENTGAWEYRPDAAFGQSGFTQPPVVTEATVIKNNTNNQSSDCMPDPGILSGNPDLTEMVKTGVQTGFELATGKLTMPTWFLKNPYLTDDQLLFRMERGLIQLKQHRDQNQLFFPEDLNKYFTELSAFKGCYFTYNLDSLGGAKNLGELTKGNYWQRITVAQEDGAKCIVTLFDGKEGQMQFHAVLTGSTENKSFKAEKVMAEYSRLRAQRHKDFASKNRALRYFLYSASAFKPKEEWCKSPFEWLDFFEKNHPLMARRYAELVKKGLSTDDNLAAQAWKDWEKLLRDQRFERAAMGGGQPAKQFKDALQYSLYLNNFGVYNCDQIFRFGGEGTIYVNAAYKTEQGKSIVPAFVSVMEKRTKAFLTLPSSAKIMYSPGRQLDIIVTDRDGRQYLFSRDKYAKQEFNAKGFTMLTVEDVTEKTNTPKAWAELLSI